MKGLVWAVGLLGAAAGAGAARADGRPTAVVAGACGPGASQAQGRLRDVLALELGGALQPQDTTLARLGGRPRRSAADLQKVLQAARESNIQGSFGDAERALEGALPDVLLLPPDGERSKLVHDLHASLAQAYAADAKASGKDRAEKAARADAVMGELLGVEPDYVPDPRRYPPSVRELAQKARAAAKKLPHATLTVTSQPAGLPVFVSGRELGPSPQTVSLPTGRYRVEVAFGAHRGLAQEVALDAGGESVAFDQSFEGSLDLAEGPCLALPEAGAARAGPLLRLADRLRVQQVVSARVQGGLLVASLLDATQGRETREGAIPAQSDPAAAAALAHFLLTGEVRAPVQARQGGPDAKAADKPQAPQDRPERQTLLVVRDPGAPPLVVREGDAAVAPPSASHGPSGLRMTSYILGGAGVLAVGTGGYFAYHANDLQKQLDGLKVPGGTTYRTGTEGQVTDLNGKIGTAHKEELGFLIGGGVAVAASVVLFLVSGEPDPEATHAGLGAAPGGLAYRF